MTVNTRHSVRASLAACKRITNKTGCHRAGGHGTSARDLNRNARTFTTGKLVSDARLSRHFVKIYKEDTYVNHFRHVLSSDQYLSTGGYIPQVFALV